MSDSFDPYHRWLGIAPKHQPADYYRLLGIDRFEADPEVIADAAERQISHVRRYQLGQHSDLSQRILNELATAKGCLLIPAKKAEYDRKLREREAGEEQAVPQPAPPSASPLRPIIVPSPPRSDAAAGGEKASAPKLVLPDRSRRPRSVKRGWLPEKLRPQVPPVAIHGAAVVGGIMLGLVVVLVWSLWPGSDARDVAEADGAKAATSPAEVPLTPSEVTPGESEAPETHAEASKPVGSKVAGLTGDTQPAVAPDNAAKPDAPPEPAKVELPRAELGKELGNMAKSLSGRERDRMRHRAELGKELGNMAKSLPRPPLATSPFDAAVVKEHQRQWAAYQGVEVEFTNSIGMKLVLIPAGEFLMGSPPDDRNADSAEKPQHTVRITKPFYLGVTEVTQEQYERVIGQNPSGFKGDPQRPVENVSWKDAVAFCGKLSEQDGRTYRLPTEAEWEYACRAGTQTRFSFGDEDKDLGEYAWFTGNSGATAHPIGQKKPNAWGLYDMHGNVWEWCADWYGAEYYKSSPQDDPLGLTGGSRRVIRGGGWFFGASYCRASCRYGHDPGDRFVSLGCRLASQFPSSSK